MTAATVAHTPGPEDEPLDLDTLVDERDALLSEIREIEVELGQPRRLHPDGSEYDLTEFHAWRRSAKFARARKLTRYREVKEQLQQIQREQRANGALPGNKDRTEILLSIDARLATMTSLLEQMLGAMYEPEAEVQR